MGLISLTLAAAACGSSVAPDAGSDAPIVTDASPDVAPDVASDVGADGAADVASDAGTDATGDMVTPACDIPAVYTFGPDGGLVAFRTSSRIEPGRRYSYSRVPAGEVDAGACASCFCSTMLDYCGTSDGGTVDTLMVINALNDADVSAAFADQTRTLYGTDPRPADGAVFAITRGDGRHFEVGGDCGGSAGCRAVPAGLARLRTVLTTLQDQQLARPECASVGP